MTVFIVSLFLPNTLHFDVKANSGKTSPREKRPVISDRSASQIRLGDYHNSQADSVLQQALKYLGKNKEDSSHGLQALLSSPLGEEGPRLAQFAKSLGIQPHEAHSPKWGRTSYFSQPKLQVPEAPASSVLHHGMSQAQVEQPSRTQRPVTSAFSGSSTRSSSNERALREAEYSILPAEQGNGGLRNAVNSVVNAGKLDDCLWIGSLGMPTDALPQERKEEIESKMSSDHECLVVWNKDSDFEGHYTHFCRTILWPIFHYQIPDNPRSKAYLDHSWSYYEKVNQNFADTVVKHYKKGDIIWVHDYHLLLVPAMVRKKIPDAKIGFYMHVAFPSSEVFRCLSTRRQMLEGLLGANLIGFQTNEYGLHFLQTCNRLLGAEATPTGIQLEDRFVDVGNFPIGIDSKALEECRVENSVQDWLKIIQERYKDKFVIVARDKLDNVRGVRQKLLAYELFLKKYPQYHEKVVLIQVASSTSERSEVETSVSEIVTRINSSHSTLRYQPIVYLKQDIDYSQFLAMLSAADALMITSLREGMNLTCHEFLYLQDGKFGPKKHGSLILSEFTGSASILGESALTVNPWDYQQCAEAIRKAIEMSPEDKESRWNQATKAVDANDSQHWYNSFVDRLNKAWEEHSLRDTVSVPRLSVNELIKKYRHAGKRLFMLDYEGTMAANADSSSTGHLLSSPQRTLDALSELVDDSRNIVYVMSGRKPEDLERLFARVPGIGLIAENGCFLRTAGQDEWTDIANRGQMTTWKNSVGSVLQYYQERLDGSWIEERHCSIVFHYEDAKDPSSATKQAADCANHLNDACQSMNVHALTADNCLIVETLSWSKATAAELVLDRLKKQSSENGQDPPEFLMVCGNARDDEVVYRWANGLGKSGTIRDVMTVSVSNRNTEAMSTLTQGVSGVLSALNKLAAASA